MKEEWEELKRTKATSCPKCSKQLADFKGLKRHLNEVHALEKSVKCEDCSKCFVSVHRLKIHRKASHLGIKPPKLNLECFDCGAIYHNKVHLRDHMYHHLGIRPFKCEICLQDYSSSKNLKRHLLIHKKSPERSLMKGSQNPNIENFSLEEWMQLIRDKVTVCPKCNKEFANPKYMRKHMRDIHSSIKEHICDQCGHSYKTGSSLREHRKHMHSEKGLVKKKQKFTCMLCGLESATKYTLRDHMNTHTGERHMCDICGRSYASVKHLKRHKIKHLKAEGMLPEEMIHRCTVCPREFTQNCELKKHLEWVHGDKYHLCKVCGAKIKGSLKQHMITHTGEKKYCCHICGKHLRGKLKEHMLTHSNERPFACSICGSTFKDKWYLRIHMRKHNGERPYVCTVCGQSFAARSAYTLHAKKHDGPSSFECEYCEQVCPSKHLLKIHLKDHFSSISA